MSNAEIGGGSIKVKLKSKNPGNLNGMKYDQPLGTLETADDSIVSATGKYQVTVTLPDGKVHTVTVDKSHSIKIDW
jgi:hypothetical protein